MNSVHADKAVGELSDLDLARRVAFGDERAFEIVMRRNNRALYRVARSILKDNAEAEDALQDAYLRASQAIHTFRGDSRLTTWLTRIVINQALERMRRREQERGAVPLENIVNLDTQIESAYAKRAEPELPDSSAMRAQMRRLLEDKIDRLPAAYRTVFVLRALEEQSVEETAASLGIAEATVRTRYFRAKRLLRSSLSREIDVAAADAFAFGGAQCDRIVSAILARLRRLRNGDVAACVSEFSNGAIGADHA